MSVKFAMDVGEKSLHEQNHLKQFRTSSTVCTALILLRNHLRYEFPAQKLKRVQIKVITEENYIFNRKMLNFFLFPQHSSKHFKLHRNVYQ